MLVELLRTLLFGPYEAWRIIRGDQGVLDTGRPTDDDGPDLWPEEAPR